MRSGPAAFLRATASDVTSADQVVIVRKSSVLVSSLREAIVTVFPWLSTRNPKAAPWAGSRESWPTNWPVVVNSISSLGKPGSPLTASSLVVSRSPLGASASPIGPRRLRRIGIDQGSCSAARVGFARVLDGENLIVAGRARYSVSFFAL